MRTEVRGLLHFAGALLASGTVYLGLAYLFKVEEVLALGQKVARRLRR